MSKCDFNKVQSNVIEIILRHVCSPVNLLHIFRTFFHNDTYRGLLLTRAHLGHLFAKTLKINKFNR